MGKLIEFPVPVRAPIRRGSRVFKPQEDMLRAMRHAHMMMAGAIVTTAVTMLVLQLLLVR
jgi:hypothetical protein